MGSLLLLVDNEDRRLPEQDAHYVWMDEGRLRASPNPPSRDLCMGYFVSEFGAWWFHPRTGQVPPELRLNGRPVHSDVELPSERAELRLSDDPYTEPPPVAQHRPGPAAPTTMLAEPSGPTPAAVPQEFIGPPGSDADIEIDHPSVVPRHARVEKDARGIWWVTAERGPVFVDGEPVDSVQCPIGTRFTVGTCEVTVPGEARDTWTTGGRALTVDCTAVTASRGGRKVLDRVSFTVPALALAVVTGPNEVGARLLLGMVGGGYRREGGDILLDGSSRRSNRRVRWVLETEDFHDTLTVRETLRFAVPPGDPERAGRTVEEVLSLLGLGTEAGHQVRTLSDALRKRLAIAQELVARPGLLVVFQSATSYDVGRDQDLMSRLHTAAHDLGCTMLVATRERANLDKADVVVVLGDDGSQRFAGAPGRVRADRPDATWAEWVANLDQPGADRFRGRAEAPVPLPPLSSPLVPDGLFAFGAAAVRRQALTFVRQGPGLLGLQLLVPVLASVLATLFTQQPAPLILVAVATAAAFGGIDVLNARARMCRDRSAGFGTGALLAARIVVHGAAAAGTAALMALAATFCGTPLGGTAAPGWATLWAALTLLMVAALATGVAGCAVAQPVQGTGETAAVRNRLIGVSATAIALLPAVVLFCVTWSAGPVWFFGAVVAWGAAAVWVAGWSLEHRLAAV